jgi:hypothetical protein
MLRYYFTSVSLDPTITKTKCKVTIINFMNPLYQNRALTERLA